MQTSFSYYPKESLFLASSLERRVKNCPFMARQLPKKFPGKAIWAWAGLAGAQAIGLGLMSPRKKTVQQKLLQSCPGRWKPETAWPVGLQDKAKWTRMKGKKKGGGTVVNIIFFKYWKDQTRLHWCWVLKDVLPWLSPSQFNFPVWYMVMPITPTPCSPPHTFLFLCFSPIFFHFFFHTFLLGSCSLAQGWTNTAKTPSVAVPRDQLPLQPPH